MGNISISIFVRSHAFIHFMISLAFFSSISKHIHTRSLNNPAYASHAAGVTDYFGVRETTTNLLVLTLPHLTLVPDQRAAQPTALSLFLHPTTWRIMVDIFSPAECLIKDFVCVCVLFVPVY